MTLWNKFFLSIEYRCSYSVHQKQLQSIDSDVCWRHCRILPRLSTGPLRKSRMVLQLLWKDVDSVREYEIRQFVEDRGSGQIPRTHGAIWRHRWSWNQDRSSGSNGQQSLQSEGWIRQHGGLSSPSSTELIWGWSMLGRVSFDLHPFLFIYWFIQIDTPHFSVTIKEKQDCLSRVVMVKRHS